MVSHFQGPELGVGKQREVESRPGSASDAAGGSRVRQLWEILPHSSAQGAPSASRLISWLSYLWLLYLLIKEEKNDLSFKESHGLEVGSLRS